MSDAGQLGRMYNFSLNEQLHNYIFPDSSLNKCKSTEGNRKILIEMIYVYFQTNKLLRRVLFL